MCFNKYTKTIEPALIADRDIECYKVVMYKKYNMHYDPIDKKYKWTIRKNRFESYFYKFTYKLDKLYKIKNLKVVCGKVTDYFYNYSITKGFHSYKNSRDAIRETKNSLHDPVVVQCIIPIGSTYYQNISEYVSNQIKIIRTL